MKRIILLSVLFGLITNTAFATYYKTTTNDCSEAAMLAKLDAATIEHRAVITEVTCGMPVVRPMPKPVIVQKPVVVQKTIVMPAPVVVPETPKKRQKILILVPKKSIVTMSKQEVCTSCDCE